MELMHNMIVHFILDGLENLMFSLKSPWFLYEPIEEYISMIAAVLYEPIEEHISMIAAVLKTERAERERQEREEAMEAEDLAEEAAEAEAAAAEAARLAAEQARKASDESTRKAAEEAEKKALAEAMANKEKRLRANLNAAKKSRKAEKLENSITEAKNAKMPSKKL